MGLGLSLEHARTQTVPVPLAGSQTPYSQPLHLTTLLVYLGIFLRKQNACGPLLQVISQHPKLTGRTHKHAFRPAGTQAHTSCRTVRAKCVMHVIRSSSDLYPLTSSLVIVEEIYRVGFACTCLVSADAPSLRAARCQTTKRTPLNQRAFCSLTTTCRAIDSEPTVALAWGHGDTAH